MDQNALYKELFDLSGKVAIVTGATKGLGREIAGTLSLAGAKVGLCSRHAEEAREAAAGIERETGNRVFSMAADVSEEGSIKGFIRAVEEQLGPVDILVAGAGINIRKDSKELTEQDWDAVMDINVKGAFLTARAALPGMRARRYGRIVFMGSILSFIGLPGRAAYASSKAALLGLTRAMALEAAADGVCVNAICPGPFDTPMNIPVIRDPEKNAAFVKSIPMGRWGKPGELRGLTLLLCSPAASFITGAAYLIDGGWTAR